MNQKEIYNALVFLAQSQGSYNRLLESWIEWDMVEVVLAELESYKPKNIVDLIFIIEGGM